VANVYDLQKVLRSDFLERLGELRGRELAALDDGLRLALDLSRRRPGPPWRPLPPGR